jgi:hypothetical protein
VRRAALRLWLHRKEEGRSRTSCPHTHQDGAPPRRRVRSQPPSTPQQGCSLLRLHSELQLHTISPMQGRSRPLRNKWTAGSRSSGHGRGRAPGVLQRPARAQEAPHGVLARVREVLQVQLILGEPRTQSSADGPGASVPRLGAQAAPAAARPSAAAQQGSPGAARPLCTRSTQARWRAASATLARFGTLRPPIPKALQRHSGAGGAGGPTHLLRRAHNVRLRRAGKELWRPAGRARCQACGEQQVECALKPRGAAEPRKHLSACLQRNKRRSLWGHYDSRNAQHPKDNFATELCFGARVRQRVCTADLSAAPSAGCHARLQVVRALRRLQHTLLLPRAGQPPQQAQHGVARSSAKRRPHQSGSARSVPSAEQRTGTASDSEQDFCMR